MDLLNTDLLGWGAEAEVVTTLPDGPLLKTDLFDKEYEGSRVKNGIHYLPRNYCSRPHYIVNVPSCESVEENFRVTFKPYNECQESLGPQLRRQANKEEDFILQAGTGQGKCYLGSAFAGWASMRTLIVVPKSDLMEQWKKALFQVLGLKEDEIGLIRGDTCDIKKVTLGSLQSVWKPGRYPKEIYSAFGTVIFDEVHLLGADLLGKACRQFNSRIRVGMSATHPDERRDGRGDFIQAHCGEVLFKWESAPLIPRVFYRETGWNRIPEWMKSFKPHRMGHVLKRMVQDDRRVALAVDDIRVAFKEGRDIGLFCHSLAGLKRLEDELVKIGISLENIGWYVGGKANKQLAVASRKPIKFATYGMMRYGTHISWMDTLIFYTPLANIKQSIGRILSEHPDKKQSLVIDYVDNLPQLENMFTARKKYYGEIRAPISRII